jgi:hypothetical protein
MKKRVKPALHPVIHIFHNGEVAEVNYFQDFKHFLAAQDAKVNVDNYWKQTKGKAPWQVIEYAINFRNLERILEKDADQIWCIFDIDHFLKQDKESFANALEKAKVNNINIAWSNPCFELWLMLHFELIETAISVQDYQKKLKVLFKKIGFDYKKNCEGLFGKLFDKQNTAIAHSKKISKKFDLKINPSTTVFRLVEELRKFLPG